MNGKLSEEKWMDFNNRFNNKKVGMIANKK